MKPKIVIADTDSLVASGLRHLLATEFDVVAVAHESNALVDAVRRHHPDVVLQAMSFEPLSGVEAIREVLHIDASVRIVVVTMSHNTDLAAEALRAGASAYVLKDSPASELRAAIACALEGKTYITPLMAKDLLYFLTGADVREQSPRTVTPRQREILRLLALGKSMKEVAAILNLSPRTVAFHKYAMMRMLNVKSTP